MSDKLEKAVGLPFFHSKSEFWIKTQPKPIDIPEKPLGFRENCLVFCFHFSKFEN
jgi:hypothetical protein